jgi:hypothetical protein
MLNLLERMCTGLCKVNDAGLVTSRRFFFIGTAVVAVSPLLALEASAMNENQEVEMLSEGQIIPLWEHYNDVIDSGKLRDGALGRQHLKRSLVRTLFIHPESKITNQSDLNKQLEYALEDIKGGEGLIAKYKYEDLNGSMLTFSYFLLLNKVANVCNVYDQKQKRFILSSKVNFALGDFIKVYHDNRLEDDKLENDEKRGDHIENFRLDALKSFEKAGNSFVRKMYDHLIGLPGYKSTDRTTAIRMSENYSENYSDLLNEAR